MRSYRILILALFVLVIFAYLLILGVGYVQVFIRNAKRAWMDQPDPTSRRGDHGRNRPFVMPADYKTILQPTDNDMFLLPSDDQLQNMSSVQLTQLYWRYIQTLQVLCRNQLRVGKLHDGGKEVCIDGAYFPRKPCLVYSFGINFQFDFDLDAVKHFGCEVHCFDPSMDLTKGQIPSGVHFHLEGLGGTTGMQNKWKMSTLQDFMKRLGHENKTLDILKFDIEGGEWQCLPEMISSNAIQQAKQLQIETHWTSAKAEHLSSLRRLYEAGFRIFMHERNLCCVRQHATFGEYTIVNEISLLNMKYYK